MCVCACVHVRVRVCVRSRVSRRSERDTAVIDLNLAKAQMLHAEGKMAAELEQMRQLLEAQGSKLLVASRAGKDSERLRGKLEASLRLSYELHSQVKSERAREHLLPNGEKPSRACGGGDQELGRQGSAGSLLASSPLASTPAEAPAGRAGSGRLGGEVEVRGVGSGSSQTALL